MIPLMGIKMMVVSACAAGSLLLSGCAGSVGVEGDGGAAQRGSVADTVPSAGDKTRPGDHEDSLTASLATFGLGPGDPRAIIDTLDTLAIDRRPTSFTASVRPDVLVLTPQGGEPVTLALAADEFYLSIAPYVTETHPCTFHSLTTCLGELRNTPVDVTVSDAVSGNVVRSGRTSTADNGFVGVWLPRGGSFIVRVATEAGAAEQLVSTGARDPTCLTTLQLRA